MDEPDRVVGRLVGSAAEHGHAVADRDQARTDQLGDRRPRQAVRRRSPEGTRGQSAWPSPRRRDRRVLPGGGLVRGPSDRSRHRGHPPDSTFWSRTWPRATSLSSSRRRISTCQSCCVRPWWIGVATTSSRPLAVRAQEVGEVRDADGLHALVLDRLERAGRRERLDRRRVEPAVDEPPRLVVALVGRDRSRDASRAALVELDLEQAHELAPSGLADGRAPVSGSGFVTLPLVATSSPGATRTAASA